MGLTTGLGWSDSEDEDAPSTLTRRLIATTLERQRGNSVSSSSRPSSMLYSDVGSSRFASPVPSSSSILPRKMSSHSSLRSASVSFPSKSPVLPASGPGQGLRIPRGRAVSASAPGPSRFRPVASGSALPSIQSSLSSGAMHSIAEDTLVRAGFSPAPTELESTNASSSSLLTQSTGRSRAESTASTASNVTSTSVTSSSHSRILPKSPYKAFSALPVKKTSIPAFRARTESSASTTTNETAESSTASSYSQHSSSTSVPSSSSSGVPRPLRLPEARATNIKTPMRSFSQDTSTSILQLRQRTLSNPQSGLSTPSSATQRVRTTSNSLSSGVLPPGALPTLRQRPLPAGARPRPRTGTGMVYRTNSSYTSFHESGNKMRSSSVVSP
jgi:hypothetical protein